MTAPVESTPENQPPVEPNLNEVSGLPSSSPALPSSGSAESLKSAAPPLPELRKSGEMTLSPSKSSPAVAQAAKRSGEGPVAPPAKQSGEGPMVPTVKRSGEGPLTPPNGSASSPSSKRTTLTIRELSDRQLLERVLKEQVKLQRRVRRGMLAMQKGLKQIYDRIGRKAKQQQEQLTDQATGPSKREKLLAQQNKKMQQDIRELNQRLSTAMRQLATKDPSQFTRTSASAHPQHDQLLQAFRQYRNHDFQMMSRELYECSRDADKKEKHRVLLLAEYQALLTREIFRRGSNALSRYEGLRDLKPLATAIKESLRQTLHERGITEDTLPGTKIYLFRDLDHLVEKGLQLVHGITQADPIGKLILPKENARYHADKHEVHSGCPKGPGTVVRVTLYPGYELAESGQVYEKAQVFTHSAG